MAFPIGPVISAGASLIGGLLGKKADKQANRIAMEREDTAIQRRVKDAEAAGIHPIYALGGAGAGSSAPISTGGIGNVVQSMGQDIGRAVDAARTGPQRQDAYTAKLRALQLERGSLENILLRSQILNENKRTPGHPPAMPISGQRDAVIAGQGDGRRFKVGGITVAARAGESPASAWEDEYGDASDIIGAARLARDSSASATSALKSWAYEHAAKFFKGNKKNDLFYLRGPWYYPHVSDAERKKVLNARQYRGRR